MLISGVVTSGGLIGGVIRNYFPSKMSPSSNELPPKLTFLSTLFLPSPFAVMSDGEPPPSPLYNQRHWLRSLIELGWRFNSNVQQMVGAFRHSAGLRVAALPLGPRG